MMERFNILKAVLVLMFNKNLGNPDFFTCRELYHLGVVRRIRRMYWRDCFHGKYKDIYVISCKYKHISKELRRKALLKLAFIVLTRRKLV